MKVAGGAILINGLPVETIFEVSDGYRWCMKNYGLSREATNQCGIYYIRCLGSDRRYVGSTIRPFKERWKTHRLDLRRRKYPNSVLQRAFDKYGEENFVFEIREGRDNWEIMSLRQREQQYIDTGYFHYNTVKDVVAPMKGLVVSEETKKLMSLASLGKPKSAKHRENISLGRLAAAITLTQEQKEHLSICNTGERHPQFGTHHSEGHKNRIGAANKYKTNIGVVRVDPSTFDRKVYSSYPDAAKDGFDARNIDHCIKKGWRHKGYLWEKPSNEDFIP